MLGKKDTSNKDGHALEIEFQNWGAGFVNWAVNWCANNMAVSRAP